MKVASCLIALSVVALASVAQSEQDVEIGEKDVATGDEIMLESFADPKHTWKQMNDPVMGGKSTGTFGIENGVGIFEGEVVDVPFLHAPGFIQSRTIDNHAFPDVSSCRALSFRVKSNTDYSGYRVSFGKARPPGGKRYASGFKSDLVGVSTDEFEDIVIDFDDFTNYWDDATGDAIVTCKEDATYCPTAEALQNLLTMAVWGEGVAGEVSLEIESIKAVGCFSKEI